MICIHSDYTGRRTMFCPKCGKELRRSVVFCPYCGEKINIKLNEDVDLRRGTLEDKSFSSESEAADTVSSKETKANNVSHPKNHGKSSRKKHYFAVILCVMVACIVVGFCVTHSLNRNRYTDLISSYATVNDALQEIVASDEYMNSDTDVRAGLLLDEMDVLENGGYILSDSIQYDEENYLISYRYEDGTYGGVMLKDFEEGTSGASGSYATEYSYSEEEEVWKVINWPAVPSFETESTPYQEEELKALIICDLGDGYESYLEMAQEEQSAWSEAYLTTELETDGSVSFFRSELDGYDFVSIQEHGIIYEGNPLIELQETVSFANYLAKNAGMAYTREGIACLNDFQDNRLAMILMDDREYHYCLLSEFISYYYDDDLLEGSIIWLGCCSGYSNDSLVESFADCGADVVLGCTETISTTYNFLMQDAFVFQLLRGKIVQESLTFSQSVWGENDSIFCADYADYEDDTPSEIRNYNGGDETLVTLADGIYVTEIIDLLTSVEYVDADGEVISQGLYEYGESGVMIKSVIDGSSDNNKTTRYYNQESGALSQMIWEYSGRIRTYNYDINGKTTDISLSYTDDEGEEFSGTIYYEYNGNTGYAYSDDGTEYIVEEYDDGHLLSMIDYVNGINRETHTYSYDEAGNVLSYYNYSYTTWKEDDGDELHHKYANDYRYEYNESGCLTKIVSYHAYYFGYAEADMNDMELESEINLSYNEDGICQSAEYTFPDSDSTYSLIYSYDETGKLQEVTRYYDGEFDGSFIFTYDVSVELTEEETATTEKNQNKLIWSYLYNVPAFYTVS